MFCLTTSDNFEPLTVVLVESYTISICVTVVLLSNPSSGSFISKFKLLGSIFSPEETLPIKIVLRGDPFNFTGNLSIITFSR